MSEEIFDIANERTKILFVCSRNKRRSLTAENIFKNELAWDVRSAGTEDGARIKVTAGMLGWADVIVVMEKRHKERLRQKYPEELAAKPCACLFIADDYEFMDSNLIKLLREKMQEHFPAAKNEQPSNEGTTGWRSAAFIDFSPSLNLTRGAQFRICKSFRKAPWLAQLNDFKVG